MYIGLVKEMDGWMDEWKQPQNEMFKLDKLIKLNQKDVRI